VVIACATFYVTLPDMFATRYEPICRVSRVSRFREFHSASRDISLYVHVTHRHVKRKPLCTFAVRRRSSRMVDGAGSFCVRYDSETFSAIKSRIYAKFIDVNLSRSGKEWAAGSLHEFSVGRRVGE